jgi:Cupredoxin-like domain
LAVTETSPPRPGFEVAILERPVRTRSDPSGHHAIEITVHRGYRPDAIRAHAGIPLRIVFRREDDNARSGRVVFSNPRLDHRLLATGATTIDLPAPPLGEIRFTCGMGRHRGHIEIVDVRRAPILARLRDRLNRLRAPLGRELILRICSLPVFILVVVLAGDAWVVITAADLTLVALVVLWLWAFRSSRHPT